MADKPLLDLLRDLDPELLPLHMPGHKRNLALAPYLKALGAGIDITEISGFDNMHDPRGVLKDLMDRAASLYGAHTSFPLVNGATAGILAGVRALSRPGDQVLLQRGSHLSVYNAIALNELRPVYLRQPLLPDPGILGSLPPEALQAAIAAHPEASLLVLTCPTYEGVLSDLDALVALAKAKGMKVLVDAAHGAHLGLAPGFAKGAVASGADIVVHSLHKTLPSLTQTALAHAADAASAQALGEALDIFQTTSPSYLLLAAIDGCLRLLAAEGAERFARWRRALDAFYEATRGLGHLSLFRGGHPQVWGFDDSKLLIDCSRADLTGQALMTRLRDEYQIELETAGERFALAMTGTGDNEDGLDRLARALLTIDAGLSEVEQPPALPLPESQASLSPGEALRQPWELISLPRAVGRVSAELVSLYPPGVPLLVPGEVISGEAVKTLQRSEALYSRSKRAPGQVAVLAAPKMDSL